MNQRIDFEVVGNANFAAIYAQLEKLKVSIANVNNQSIGAGFTKELQAGLKNAESSFLTTVSSLRNMQVETVKVSDATAHLTEQFVKSRLSTSQYFDIWKNRSKETIPILNDIAQQQAKVANSFIVPSAAKAGYAQVITDMGSVAQKSMVAGIQQKAYNTAMMDASNKIINFGKNTQWAGRQLTVGFTVPLAAAGAALANMYYQVDKNMQMLQRTYGIGGAAGQAFTKALPSQAELDKIKTQVQQISQQMANMYGQSAQETTSVAAALSAAGYTQDQLINLTKTVSQAMVLGETDMQSAMKATISLQTAYKLSTSQTADAMNFFSAAQAATSTTMKDLIDAIPRVGPIVQNLGGTYKDTVAFLVAMKEGGVGASDGANALKNSLQRLIVPTKAAVTSLMSYGIDLPNLVKENTGNVVGMIESLQMALNKLPQLARQQAITELFGKFQAARVTALLDNFNRTGTQSAKVMNMMSLSSKDLTDIAAQQTNVLQQSSSGRFKIAVESLKASLLPIGQAFLDMATKVLNAVTGIVNIFQKLGPLKYIISGLLGGAAILGPIIMFSGLMANLVGQVFKLTNMMRMFKEGAGSGGGWSSPFKAIQSGLSGLANYFEEIDKAQLASSKLSETVSSQMGTQAKMLDLFNVALTRYTDNIQRLMQIEAGSKFGPGNIGGLGGPGGGSPIGGGPYIVPSSGGGGAARTPEQVLAQAGYVNTMFITGKDETGKGIRRNLVEQTEMGPMGGVTFSHGLANEVTQSIMGSRSIVPGIFTNTPQGKEINLKNQDQTLPLIPSQMMTTEVVTTVLNELGIKPQGPISAYGKELSTVTAVKQSGDQLAQLRALREIEMSNPDAVSSFKSLAKMGANYEDTNNWFNQQLGPEQWAGMRQKAMADVKNTYDQAFNSFEASIKASGGTGVKPENFRAIATDFYKSTSSMFLEQYNGMSAAMQNALTVTSTQTGEKLADRIRGSMKDSLAPAMINSLAASSNGLEYLGTAFNELGTTVQDATKKMAAEVTALAEKINLIAAESMVGGVGKVSMPGNVGRVIPKFASGGKITGPGGPRDDKIPALLSNGEYVVNAAAVSQYGNGFLDAINTRKFADGGRVANTNYENAPAQISPTMGESVTTPRYAMGGMTQDVSREMLYDSSMGYAKGGSARRKGSFTHHRQFGYHPRRFKYASGGLAALSEMFMAKKEMFSSAEIESYLRTPESLYIGNAVDKFFMTRNADALKNVKTEDIARVIESHQLNNSEKEAQLAAALELHASDRYGQKEPLRNLDPQIVSAGAKSIQDALAQVPGDTVRLYRAVRFPNNGVDTGRNLAPGHFGYTAGPIEAPQPYYSMSLDPTLPMNFARPSGTGETGRVIEIDVPKSAIIGIQGANYSGRLGEKEFVVRADGIPQSGQRYVNPYGLASIPKNAEDPFLSRLAPPGPESIKFTVQDISQRYRKQKPSGADYAIQGWAGASDKDRYGITPEELKFAQQYLEGKYSMPMSELKKGKYDKMFPTQGYNVASEDYYIRQMLQHQLGYRKYDPLLPIIADKPGMASYVFSEPMITGRKDGGMISKFVDGGGPGKRWTLSELWASSGGENLFVNHLSQNEDLLKLVMSEIIDSKEIKQSSKDKLLSTIPFNLNPRNTDYAPTVEQDFAKILKKMLDEGAFGEQNPDFYARLGATIAMPDYRSYTPSLLEQAGGIDETIYGGLTSKGTVRRDAPYKFRSLSRQAASESMQIAPGSELDKRAMARDIVATHFSNLDFGKSFLAEIEKRLSQTYLNTHTAHGFANGSYVSGPGGPKDDMIPAMLSNGEYVVNADAVKHYGVGFVDAINSRKFANGGISKFDSGNIVTMTGGIGKQTYKSQWSPTPGGYYETGLSPFAPSTQNVVKDSTDQEQKQKVKIWKNKAYQAEIEAARQAVENAKKEKEISSKKLAVAQAEAKQAEISLKDAMNFDQQVQVHYESLSNLEKEAYQKTVISSKARVAAAQKTIIAAEESIMAAREEQQLAAQGLAASQAHLRELQAMGGVGPMGRMGGKLGKFMNGMGGMGIMMAGQAIGGVLSTMSSNASESAGGQTMASGAMGGAGTGLSIGSGLMMMGIPGIIAGVGVTAISAIYGAISGAQEQHQREFQASLQKDRDSTSGVTAQFKVGSDAMQMFGLHVKTIADINFDNVTSNATAFRNAIDQLSDALKNSADSATKNYLKTLSAAAPKDQVKMLQSQYRAIIAAGGNSDQAKVDLLANARVAGVSMITATNALNQIADQFKNYSKQGLDPQVQAFLGNINTKLSYPEIPKIPVIADKPKDVTNAGPISPKTTTRGTGNALPKIKEQQQESTQINPSLKTLFNNFSKLPKDFNFEDFVTLANDSTIKDVIKNKNLTSSQLINNSNNNISTFAKAAGVQTTDSLEAANNKLTQFVNGINGLTNSIGPDGAQKTLNDLQNSFAKFNSETIQPISQAMLNLNPKQFKQFINGLSSDFTGVSTNYSPKGRVTTDSGFAGLSSTGFEALNQVVMQAYPEFGYLVQSLKGTNASVPNFMSALNLLAQGLQLTAGQIQMISQDKSGKLLTNAQDQSAYQNAEQVFANKESTGTSVDYAAQNAKQQELATKNSKTFAKTQKDEQKAFNESQKRIQEEIRSKNKYIDSIKKEMDARQKLYDKKQQQAQQDLTLQNLQNDISRSRNSGDLLGLALAQSQYNDELNRQADLKAKEAADAKDQSKIDTATSAANKLSDAMQKNQDRFDAMMQSQRDTFDAQQQGYQDSIDRNNKLAATAAATAAKNSADISLQVGTIDKYMQSPAIKGEKFADFIKAHKKTIDQLAKDTGTLPSQVEANLKPSFDAAKAWMAAGGIKFNTSGTVTSLDVQNGNITLGNGVARFVPVGGVSTLTTSQIDTSRVSRAQGGPIYGPGTKTSDSIPAMLSHGEYVVKASSVDKYGTGFLDAVNNGNYAAGGFIRKFATGGQVADYSKQFAKGKDYVPYKYEPDGVGFGNGMKPPSPQNGWGCATSVAWLYEQFGVNLPDKQLSMNQANGLSQEVPRNNLQKGDLLFFRSKFGLNNNPINHVGMYVGGGKIFEAQSPSAGTVIDGINWNNFVVAKRVINDSTGAGAGRGGADRAGGAGGQQPASTPASTPPSSSASTSLTEIVNQIKNMIIPMKGQISFAEGGKVSGPGTGTSDSIPARLSNGEYVVKSDSVNHYGTGFMDSVNSKKFGSGGSTSENSGPGNGRQSHIIGQVDLAKRLISAGFTDKVALMIAWAVAETVSGGDANMKSPYPTGPDRGGYKAGLFAIPSNLFTPMKANINKIYDASYQAKLIHSYTNGWNKNISPWGFVSKGIYALNDPRTKQYDAMEKIFPAIYKKATGKDFVEKPPPGGDFGPGGNPGGGDFPHYIKNTDLVKLLQRAGFTKAGLLTAWSVAMEESGGNEKLRIPKSGLTQNRTFKAGLFQVPSQYFKPSKMNTNKLYDGAYQGKFMHSYTNNWMKNTKPWGFMHDIVPDPRDPRTARIMYYRNQFPSIYKKATGQNWGNTPPPNPAPAPAPRPPAAPAPRPPAAPAPRPPAAPAPPPTTTPPTASASAAPETKPTFWDNVLTDFANAGTFGYAFLSSKYYSKGGTAQKGVDTIPAMLSNGEYVVNSNSVNKYGLGFMNSVNEGKYSNGGSVKGYAKGGVVGKFAGGGMPTYIAGNLSNVKNINNKNFETPSKNVRVTPSQSDSNTSSVNNIQYNVNVSLSGSNLDPNDVAKVVINTIKQKERANSSHRQIGT